MGGVTYTSSWNEALITDPAEPAKKAHAAVISLEADGLEIDYINAMVPRGDPSTDQWQEHVDGKPNYNPPILPKAPARLRAFPVTCSGPQSVLPHAMSARHHQTDVLTAWV